VNPDGSGTCLDTELPPLNLVAAGYNASFPFVVDSLAIMAYNDGFTDPGDPSLVADLKFQRLSFWTPALQPPSHVSVNVLSTNVVLTFPTMSNFTYDVQSTTNLVSCSWSTIASNIPGTGGVVTNLDVGAAAVPQRFYRVGLIVPIH